MLLPEASEAREFFEARQRAVMVDGGWQAPPKNHPRNLVSLAMVREPHGFLEVETF